MTLRWKQFHQQYEALSLRERILVSASILIAIVVLWYILLFSPMYASHSDTQTQFAKLQTSIKTLQQQQQTLQQRQQQDPLRELKERIAQLNKHITDTDERLKDKLHGLIPPQQMAKVLESVLQQHHELTLIKLQSLPATPLITRAAASDKTEAKTPVQGKSSEVYRHGLQLEFEGSYLATLAYLKALQTLPWEFYWDEVRLDVEKYPRAKVTITVHTLSLTEGWIGV
ncbi:MAG: hypothetical protein GC149_10910 [Gammaproteobacteria bacterium]|nr:hypothetical protein [Gammaproteobacteria bacterium]